MLEIQQDLASVVFVTYLRFSGELAIRTHFLWEAFTQRAFEIAECIGDVDTMVQTGFDP